MKILNTIGENFTPEGRDTLSSLGKTDYIIPTQDELTRTIGEYDAALIGLGLNFDKRILDNAQKLKVIATATTGLDHIDVKTAEEKGITILSLRGETEFLNSITGTAELAAGLMIDLMRFTPWAFDDVKKYHWDRESFRGHNLYGATLGIVGMGRLGTWMARYGKAFNMKVLYTDPNVSKSPVSGCKKVSLDELLNKSDVVSVHVHLSPETKNMFNKALFKKMKKTAYLINTSRGEIVHEADLLAVLKNGDIAGYGTDVLAGELEFNKSFTDYPLVEYAKTNKNVIVVPHIGGMTHESRKNTDIFMAHKLADYLKDSK